MATREAGETQGVGVAVEASIAEVKDSAVFAYDPVPTTISRRHDADDRSAQWMATREAGEAV